VPSVVLLFSRVGRLRSLVGIGVMTGGGVSCSRLWCSPGGGTRRASRGGEEGRDGARKRKTAQASVVAKSIRSCSNVVRRD
jgi:hypothetical protein